MNVISQLEAWDFPDILQKPAKNTQGPGIEHQTTVLAISCQQV